MFTASIAATHATDLWILETDRGVATRFTSDGRRVTFSCHISADWDICWAPRSGGGVWERGVLLGRRPRKYNLSRSSRFQVPVNDAFLIRGIERLSNLHK